MAAEYDVFLSHKNLDPGGQPTQDAPLARAVHDQLSDRGLRVFLSNISLEKLGAAAYQQAIDAALESALVLVAVGTTAEHFESHWVRYEWESFYNDILSGRKPRGRVFSYVAGLDPSALPRILRQNQAIIHQPPGSYQQLCQFIVNALTGEPADGAVHRPQKIEVTVSGNWWTRPPNQPLAPWCQVALLPGPVTVYPGEEAYISLGPQATDAHPSTKPLGDLRQPDNSVRFSRPA